MSTETLDDLRLANDASKSSYSLFKVGTSSGSLLSLPDRYDALGWSSIAVLGSISHEGSRRACLLLSSHVPSNVIRQVDF